MGILFYSNKEKYCFFKNTKIVCLLFSIPALSSILLKYKKPQTEIRRCCLSPGEHGEYFPLGVSFSERYDFEFLVIKHSLKESRRIAYLCFACWYENTVISLFKSSFFRLYLSLCFVLCMFWFNCLIYLTAYQCIMGKCLQTFVIN